MRMVHKGAFRDAIALRYGWLPSYLPSSCTCGTSLTVEYAISCPFGGFPSISHNEIRDLCHNVSIGPNLQAITGETFATKSANTEDGARSDIAAGGLFVRTFFDFRVFNPYAPPTTPPHYPAATEDMKIPKRENITFESMRLNRHHSSHSPLFNWRDDKWSTSYKSDHGMGWLHCRLSFSLLRSSIQCIRGARSNQGHAIHLPSSI